MALYMSFETLQPILNLWAIGIGFFWILRTVLWTLTEQLKKTIDLLIVIESKIEKTTVSSAGGEIILEAVMADHKRKKINYIKYEVLQKNHINTRWDAIRKNIKAEFIKITQEEVVKLNNFVLESSKPLWQDLSKVDLTYFLDEVYAIVFAKDDADKKLNDLDMLITWYVTDLKSKLRE